MIQSLYKKLIVSCQAKEGSPLDDERIMAKMASSAVLGGAAAIRAAGIKDILEIKKNVNVPIIGLIKKNYPNSEVYITPTKDEVNSLLASNCEIIALDATNRKRPNNTSLKDLLTIIHKNNRFALGDISTLEEALYAEQLGFDLVATTLSGYTSYSPTLIAPDYKLLKSLIRNIKIPVIAEGRIYNENVLEKVLRIGPYAVVIGTAITNIEAITKRYCDLFG